MNMQTPAPYNDEIDLGALFQVLWKRRLIILIITLGAAILGYAVSEWVLPKQYTAVAYVLVGKPAVQYQNVNGALLVNPSIPDIKALPEIVIAPSLMNSVKADQQIKALNGAGGSKLPSNMQVAAVGTTQLRFSVVDTDPERAATIANVWAQKAADWIEFNYGVGGFSASVESQLAQAQKNYAEAEAALEAMVAQDQTPILQIQVEVNNEINACLEKRLIAENSILGRLAELETQIRTNEGLVSQLNLLRLAVIGKDFQNLENCTVLSGIIPWSPFDNSSEITTAQGLDGIFHLREEIERDIELNQAKQQKIQQDILKLQEAITKFSYQKAGQVRQLTQTEFIYDQLVFQKMVIETTLQQSGRVAYVNMEAVTPKSSSSTKPLVSAGAAGVLGLALSGLGVLIGDWWRKFKLAANQ